MLNIITSPQILTDDIFSSYGGATGTSTPAQRQAAYCIAEGEAATEIGTFVAPTTVTGTHAWPPMGEPVMLQYTHLNSIGAVTALHDVGCDCEDDAVTLEGCAWILDVDGSIISLRECNATAQGSCARANCSCGIWNSGRPYRARIAYTAGLPTEAASDPRLLLGLVTVADLALQQIVDQCAAEGGPGDPGVQSYSSIGYSETRFNLRMTAFGPSARANYAANLLREFKYKRALKLGH